MSGLLHLVEAATALTQLVGPSSSSQQAPPSLSTSPLSTDSGNATTLPVSSIQRTSTHAISDDDDTTVNTKIATLRENHLQALRAAAANAGLATQSAPSIQTSTFMTQPPAVATLAIQAPLPQQVRIPRGDSRAMFPMRLHALLADPTVRDVISWLPHGKSFVVLRPDVFATHVLPRYFAPEGSNSVNAKTPTALGKDGNLQLKSKSQGVHKYPSFTRKLNRWGFRQISRGPDAGAFCHELFQRDDPDLCRGMVCQKSRKSRRISTSSSTNGGGMSDDMMSVSSASTMGTKSVASIEKRPYSSTVTVSTAGAASNKSLPFKKRKSGKHAHPSVMMNGIPSMISHRTQKMAPSNSSVTESDLTSSDNSSVCSGKAASAPQATNQNSAPQTPAEAAREALARHFHEQHRAFALASLMENSRLAMAAVGMNNQSSSVAAASTTTLDQQTNMDERSYKCSPVIGAMTTHSPTVFAPTVSVPERNKVPLAAFNIQPTAAEAAKGALYQAYLQALASNASSS